MIRSFSNRNTRRFFEGHRVAAFRDWRIRLCIVSHCWTTWSPFGTWRGCPATAWKRFEATGPASTAFGSMRRRRPGQIPERGVVEVKGVEDDARITSDSDQVRRYLGRYQLVLVTNTRDFMLVGKDEEACPVKLESFCLDEDAEQFVRRLDRPRAYAREVASDVHS